MGRTQSWLWPDKIIYLKQSGRLRREHNALVHAHEDLLEACKRTVRQHSHLTRGFVPEWLLDVRAAIAKAEG